MWKNFTEFMSATGEKISTFFSANKTWIIPTAATLTTIGVAAAAIFSGGTAAAALPFLALASGTVVPPNNGEFLAMLGDNTRETEIVSPLSTMKQALMEALAESGYGKNETNEAIIELDGVQFGRLVYKFGNKENRRIGTSMRIGGAY